MRNNLICTSLFFLSQIQCLLFAAPNNSLQTDSLPHVNINNIVFKNTPPTFQMTSDASNPTKDSSIIIDGVFSKTVGLISKSDFKVKNATIATLTIGEPTYMTTLGAEFEKIESYLGAPVGLAFDKQNNLYVASFKTNRIKIYNENLEYIASIGDGSIGNGKYQFKSISDVAIDAQGFIYVVDAGNHRVQIYDSSKKHIATLGTNQPGAENYQFNKPDAIAFDNQGRVYIADQGNYRVQVLDKDYNYLATIGTTGIAGAENNQFVYPTAISISAEGMIYIVDANNHRVQVFDSNLEYIATMGVTGEDGSDNDHFAIPNGIAIDSEGNIYVADLAHFRVQKFDKDRNYVTTIENKTISGKGFPGMDLPIQVTTDSQDNMYILDPKRIHIFDSGLNQTASLGSDGSGNGKYQFSAPYSLHIDDQQKLYVGDSRNSRIQIFDTNLNYLATIQGDKTGAADDKYQYPTDIAVDELGNIYVVDSYEKHQVKVFDQNYNYIGKLGDGTVGLSNQQLSSPMAVSINEEGDIYIVDRWNHRIQIFDRNRQYKATIGNGTLGAGSNEFNNPTDIAIDQQGNIYIADPSNYRVQVFDHNRQYKATLGGRTENITNQLFFSPIAVNVDKNGNVFVVDDRKHQVKVFDKELDYLYSLGSGPGVRDYQFDHPSDIAINVKNTIYVADRQNHRIQLFSSSSYQMTVNPIKDGLLEVNLPADITSDASGNGNEAAQFTITYDNTRPSVLLSSQADSLTKISTIPLTIRFSEMVKDFGLEDIQFINATANSLSTIDSTVFTTEVVAEHEGEVIISIPEGVVEDQVGYSNEESNRLAFYSEENLTAMLSTVTDTVHGDFMVEIVFSRDIPNFSLSAVSVTNGEAVNLFTKDSTSFQLTVTPRQKGEVYVRLKEPVGTTDEIYVLYEEKVVTATIEKHPGNKFTIYPIPAQEKLTIDISVAYSIAVNLSLTTPDGKLLYQKKYHMDKQLMRIKGSELGQNRQQLSYQIHARVALHRNAPWKRSVSGSFR